MAIYAETSSAFDHGVEHLQVLWDWEDHIQDVTFQHEEWT